MLELEVSSVVWISTSCFEELGNCDDERAMRYREFVQSAIPAGEWELIREALQREQLTGTERFSDEIETIIGRRIENRKQGRPRKDPRKYICPLFPVLVPRSSPLPVGCFLKIAVKTGNVNKREPSGSRFLCVPLSIRAPFTHKPERGVYVIIRISNHALST
jgi:hypothetical protein